MYQDERLMDFFAMGNIALETKEALSEYIRRKDEPLPSDRQAPLTLTLHHIEHMREGFKITVRTSAFRSLSELQDVIHDTLMDWSWLKEYAIELLPGTEIHYPRQQTLAFAHSYVTLAVLPRFPEREITYPGEPQTYADIPVPRTPGEILARIDELERVLWEATTVPERQADPGSLRRTYGFFETSAWLVFHHMRLFLGE